VNDLTAQGNSVIFEPGKASIFNLVTGAYIELIQDDRLWKVPLEAIASLPHVEKALALTVPAMPPEPSSESVYVTN
jgi:hypothetical protein